MRTKTGAVEEQMDEEYLEQMQMEYKGTESTQEDMSGVPEVYHAIPHIEEDQLLRGEVMEASPRTESTLLADTTLGAAEAMPPATGDKATTALETVNPDILTAEEFMSMPDLESGTNFQKGWNDHLPRRTRRARKEEKEGDVEDLKIAILYCS